MVVVVADFGGVCCMDEVGCLATSFPVVHFSCFRRVSGQRDVLPGLCNQCFEEHSVEVIPKGEGCDIFRDS